VSVFDELREHTDAGLISYPFSTREQVNIVKHLQAFPHDTVGRAVANVVSFDAMDGDVMEVLREVRRLWFR